VSDPISENQHFRIFPFFLTLHLEGFEHFALHQLAIVWEDECLSEMNPSDKTMLSNPRTVK
jgi:hypothetical protein